MQIPSRPEIANALNGTWMLVKRDRGGVSWLDGSVDGFWKSFFAAVLLAPFYGLMLWMARYSTVEDADFTAVFLVEAAAYAGAWLFWPLRGRSCASVRQGSCSSSKVFLLFFGESNSSCYGDLRRSWPGLPGCPRLDLPLDVRVCSGPSLWAVSSLHRASRFLDALPCVGTILICVWMPFCI